MKAVRSHRLLLVFSLFAIPPLHAKADKPLKLFSELIPDGSAVGFADSERGLDVHGHLAAIGWEVIDEGSLQGSVSVFDISDPHNPTEVTRLTPSDNQAGNKFGSSVAVWNDRVFVGAYAADVRTGAVYMYDLTDRSNITERKLTAYDASASALFGYDIAVSGNLLIVASPEGGASSPPASAYVLDLSDLDNIRQVQLFRTDGTTGGNFAEQVDISANLAVIGHISESSVVSFNGAAHIYDLSNFDNPRQQVVRAAPPRRSETLGRTVAVDGETVLVSVKSDPGDEDLPGPADGAVWAFDFSDWDNPTQHEFGLLPTGLFSPAFGQGLDLAGNTALIGAFAEDSTIGAAYVFDVSDTNVPLELDRIASPINDPTFFGRGLAFDSTSAIISSGNRVFLYSSVPEPSTLVLSALASVGLLLARRRRALELIST